MSAPVIDPTTSVLGYKQWESWSYQPFATNGPGRWRNNTGLPLGLSLDLASGTLTGPVQTPGVFNVGLVATNGYEVTRIACKADASSNLASTWFSITGASASYSYWFKVGGSGSAPTTSGTEVEVDISANATAVAVATALEAVMLAQSQWYIRRDGAVIYAYDLTTGSRTIASDGSAPTGFLISRLSTGGSSADSAEVMFTIGIEPSIQIKDTLPQLTMDIGTGEVKMDGSTSTDYVFPAKENDDLILRVGFVRNGVPVSVSITDGLRLVLKQFEPESTIVISSAWAAEAGTGNFYLYCKFDGAAIAGALTDYEDDAGTFFYALAEIEAIIDNTLSVGPGTLTRSSSTFKIRLERDLAR